MRFSPLLACLTFVALPTLALPNLALAQATPPTLTYVNPVAARPGEAVNIGFFGTNLEKPTAVWTDFPQAKIELADDVPNNGTNKAQAFYRVTLPADAPLGVAAVRVATAQGVSNVRLLLIDDLPAVAEDSKNKSIAAAQELTLPAAVDGACEAESSDYFKFAGQAGQRLSLEVFARRLGYVLDPVVRILDESGNELAYSDDAPGLGPDCHLSLTLPTDGTYYVDLRDIRYQGGAGHRYRLRIGDFPLINTTYPLAVKRGAATTVEFAGPHAEGVPPVELTVAADAAEQVWTSAKFADGATSAIVAVATSGDNLEEVREIEPNDSPAESTPIASLPAAVNGRFDAPKDRDHYRLELKKGDRILCQGQTRAFGAPTDLFLRMYNAAGARLAEVDDTGTEEGTLDFTAPADGVFHLAVEDLLRRGGPQFAYRVLIRPYEPSFRLVVDVEKADAPLGGVFVGKVTATRAGYDGPIELALLGAPEGLKLIRHIIPEGKPETTFSATLPDNVPTGTLLNVQVVGKAKIGEKEVVVPATSQPAVQKALANLTTPPRAAVDRLAVGVGAEFPPFFNLTAEVNPLPRLVGETTVNVKAEKLNKFDDPITIAIEGLPAGYEAKAEPIAKGQPQVAIKITGPADAPVSELKFAVKGTATYLNQPRTVRLDEVKLAIVEPLSIAVAPAGPIAAGGKQKVKLTVARLADKADVTIELQNLPAGVTAPAEIKLAADQAELEIELTAAPDAAAGKVENLTALARTKVKDQDVSVASAAAVLEVTAP